ncbi:MAG TPA: phosphoribosylformylglycinamidine cyclo-ligase [Gemmatimonadaceae bacterium]|nr:phosphoribosylformylglycinamidine cyclo-ligase [Gemmatimonadaceae bacterium]
MKSGGSGRGRRRNLRAPKIPPSEVAGLPPAARAKKGKALDYAASGVDIAAADDAKHRISKLVESTYTGGAVGKFGGFGGMFRVPPSARRPILVSSADGVGTKLKVAIEAGRNDTVGHDLVNHCVNDILVQGATPLFFLDYVAFGKLVPQVLEEIVTGITRGCRENGATLSGGETAELPGVYTPPDYDLAGFIVGYVEEDAVLGPERVEDGDHLIALGSSGLHTNGYSLARRIVSDRMRLGVRDEFPGEDASVADVLLRVHTSYLKAMVPVLPLVHAMAHITGGGLPGNLNRALPPTLDAVVDTNSWNIPNVFTQLERAGGVPRDEMYRAFNMGVGMVVITNSANANAVMDSARDAGITAWTLGRVTRGSGQVLLD